MANFKKVFNLIVLTFFLCQNAAFCLPDENPVITLRPPLLTSKTFQEWRKLRNPEHTAEDIISELDKSAGYYWGLLQNNSKSRSIMHGRLTALLEDKKLPQLVKSKLKEIKEQGSIKLSDEDIENCTIFIFGDALWYSEKDKPHDIDMLIIVKGSPNFAGEEVWNLKDDLPHVAVKIKGEEDFDATELRKNLSLLRLNTGVILYGKDFVDRLALSPADIIEWAEGLIRNGFYNDEVYMGDIGDSRKEWKRFFEAYLYLYPIFVDYMPEIVKEISDNFLQGIELDDYLTKFYNGELDALPWDNIDNRDLYKFGVYLDKKTKELKDFLSRAKLLNTKLLINGNKGVVRLKISHFPDGELYLRILNPDIVNGAFLTVTFSLDSSEDLVKIVLLTDLLKKNGAKEIQLVLDKSYDIKNGLDSLLRFCCDRLFYNDIESYAAPLEAVKKDKGHHLITSVFYQHRRLEPDAKEAAEYIKATSKRIEINKPNQNPLSWTVDTKGNLKGENVILIHNTENFYDFAELWIMLIALRQAGANSVTLINTYEGYSRQDKEFNSGEAVSAETMLKILDVLVDNHMALNVHYADNSGNVKDKLNLDAFVNRYDLYNLNAFVQLAEDLFNRIVVWAREEEKDLVKEFDSHPLLLLAPDDGAFGYVHEAAVVLKRYIKKNFNLDIKVHVGYTKKQRLGGKEVKIEGKILGRDGQSITGIPNIKDCWVVVLDDETAWGTTLEAVTYALVRETGIPWPRILTGVVHGKLAQGLKPFRTGRSEKEITTAVKKGETIEPLQKYIKESNGLMPPRLFVTTKSVTLPKNFPKDQAVSIGPIIAHAAKKSIRAGL